MLQRMDRNFGRNGRNEDADAELARPTFDDCRLVLARVAVVMMAVALLLIGYLVFHLAWHRKPHGLIQDHISTRYIPGHRDRRPNVASGPAPAPSANILAPSGIVTHRVSSKAR